MSDSDLAPFAALIGTWDTTSTHPMLDGVVPGRQTFAWLFEQRFVLVRSTHAHPQVPDGLCVIGPPEDGDGLVVEYFDSRGVRRTYQASFRDGVYRWWRDQPGFEQRMSARVDGDEFVMEGQLAEEPGVWKDDLRTVFRRVA